MLFEPDGSRQRLTLDPGAPMTIGRAADCSLTIADPRVSRLHLIIEPIAGIWLARDPGSANGTFLNGVRLRSAISLRAGDVLELGDSHAQLLDSGAPSTGVTQHYTSVEGMLALTPIELAEILASTDGEFIERRRKLLTTAAADLQDEGPARLQRLATTVAETFGCERLALFVQADERHLRPLLSAPTEDDAKTLTPLAETVVRRGKAFVLRRPTLMGVTQVDPKSLQPVARFDSFTLAVPAGSCAIVLEGRRPSPVRDREELALLFAFGMAVTSFLSNFGSAVQGRIESRDPASTITNLPVFSLKQLRRET